MTPATTFLLLKLTRSSDIANSSCVKSAWEVVLGGKGAWERAASSVDARVSRAAGSTVVGVARTRAVSACLVAAICFCLAFLQLV